jgi:hypothetical protein
MADLRIDKVKAQRLVAHILRQEKKMLSADANTLSTLICNRLETAMPLPTRPGLRGDRIISGGGPAGPITKFAERLANMIGDADEDMAREVWNLVYEHARDLPLDVADSNRY